MNAVIPWAAVQTSGWVGGDPNPGTALRVDPACACFQIVPGYWLYKQVSRAGQPGMRVAAANSSDKTAFGCWRSPPPAPAPSDSPWQPLR